MSSVYELLLFFVMPEVCNRASRYHLKHWIPALKTAGMTAQCLSLWTELNKSQCINTVCMTVIPSTLN